LSVISRRAVEREIQMGLLREIPISGLSFYRTFKVVYHRHKFLTGAMEAFIDFCFREAGFIEEVSAPEKSKAPK
jgi:DNA-binding transcriptional LysR family regulator